MLCTGKWLSDSALELSAEAENASRVRHNTRGTNNSSRSDTSENAAVHEIVQEIIQIPTNKNSAKDLNEINVVEPDDEDRSKIDMPMSIKNSSSNEILEKANKLREKEANKTRKKAKIEREKPKKSIKKYERQLNESLKEKTEHSPVEIGSNKTDDDGGITNREKLERNSQEKGVENTAKKENYLRSPRNWRLPKFCRRSNDVIEQKQQPK